MASTVLHVIFTAGWLYRCNHIWHAVYLAVAHGMARIGVLYALCKQGVPSRRLRQQHPDIAARYYQGVLWSPSDFAASCGGASLSIIRQYIEDQRKNLW